MGYLADNGPADQDRVLPTLEIEGTLFLVDLKKLELRQVDDPFNRISIGDVGEESGFKVMLYDLRTRNIYPFANSGEDLPSTVKIVIVPPLKDLDPVGLARRQGYSDQYFGKPKALEKQQGSMTTFSVILKKPEGRRKKGIRF